MHWQLGKQDMAHRAGVVPFSRTTSSGSTNTPPAQSVGPAPCVEMLREEEGREGLNHAGGRREQQPLPSIAELESEIEVWREVERGRGRESEREGRGDGLQSIR